MNVQSMFCVIFAPKLKQIEYINIRVNGVCLCVYVEKRLRQNILFRKKFVRFPWKNFYADAPE